MTRPLERDRETSDYTLTSSQVQGDPRRELGVDYPLPPIYGVEGVDNPPYSLPKGSPSLEVRGCCHNLTVRTGSPVGPDMFETGPQPP